MIETSIEFGRMIANSENPNYGIIVIVFALYGVSDLLNKMFHIVCSVFTKEDFKKNTITLDRDKKGKSISVEEDK